MQRFTYGGTGPAPVHDAEWEAAHEGWAADSRAITVLEEKQSVIARAIDLDDLAGYGGGLTQAGISIGPESALRVGAVFACRRVIAEDVAKMTRHVRRVTVDADGRKKTRIIHANSEAPPADRHEKRLRAVARVLAEEPCDWLTPMQFFEWLVGTAVTQRAAYAVPTYGNDGELLELLPLLPGAVSVQQDSNWDVYYLVSGYGENWTLRPGELVQLTGPVAPQLLDGYQVSTLAADSIGLARAIELSQARFHKNDFRPSGVLTTKAALQPKQRDAIRDAWMTAYGPGGTGGIAVLDNEFDFKSLNVTAVDSQTLQSREHQISDICRFFRVFPHMIGHAGGLSGIGNFEQAAANHVSHTLVPWVERLEQALAKTLLFREERAAGYQIHIDVDSVMRGTFSDRVAAYERAVKVFITPNDVREREGMDPIDDAAMDRVQLLANNTGLQQGGAAAGRQPATGNRQQAPGAETEQGKGGA